MEIINKEEFFANKTPGSNSNRNKRKLEISETMEFKMDQVLSDVTSDKVRQITEKAKNEVMF